MFCLPATRANYLELSSQLLSCVVHIAYQDSSLEDKLAYLCCSAKHSMPASKQLHYRVDGFGPYALFEESDWLSDLNSPADVLHVIYQRVYQRLIERWVNSDWVGFHGALFNIGGKRLAMLGDKGTGKTTLSATLACEGYAVEGDEVFMSRSSQVVALPRRFHLKPGTIQHVRKLEALWPNLPLQMSGDMPIRALDPSQLGLCWRIDIAPIDAVLWITPNHGGKSALKQLGTFETLQKLVESAHYWGHSRELVVTEAARLSRHGGLELVLGSPTDAIEKLLAYARSTP